MHGSEDCSTLRESFRSESKADSEDVAIKQCAVCPLKHILLKQKRWRASSPSLRRDSTANKMPLTPPPTHLEAEYLTSLIPTMPHPLQSTEAILGEMFHLCQPSYIHKFLFTTERIQLSHFVNPHLRKNAVTCDYTSTHVDAGSKKTEDSLSEHLNTSVLLVQAFSVDNVSLGFAVNEFIYSLAYKWDSLHEGVPLKTESRFVRNDAENEMLLVLEAPDEDLVIVDYLHLLSPTHQKRHVARLSQKEFRKILYQGVMDANRLLPAVIQLQTSYEYRKCPFCDARQGVCRCRLRAASPLHPFDGNAYSYNMSLFLGTFEGVTNVKICENGLDKQVTAMGTRLSIRGDVDLNLLEKLRGWVVTKNADAPNPRQGLLSCGLVDDGFEDQVYVKDVVENVISEDLTGAFERQERAAGAMHFAQDQVGFAPSIRHGEAFGRASEDSLMERGSGRDYSGEVTPSTSDACASVDNDGKGIDPKRMEILRNRRERNRASAKRSNLKKKMMNAELRREVNVNREKIEELRERELALRQENLQLRSLLRQS